MFLQRLRARAARRNPDQALRDFYAAGNPPWKPGYAEHKLQAIMAALNDPNYDPFALPARHGWRLDERIVEYPWFYHLLPEGSGRLLDAGSALNHWPILMAPKIREKSTFISTLAPESFSAWQSRISYVYEDLRETCFRDDYFDHVACISTLEHVGMDNTMLYTGDFSKNEDDRKAYLSCLLQFHRVLRSGGTLYLTMPFGTHVNHGWFQIFDAPMVDSLIETFRPSRQRETIYRYLPEGWIVGDRASTKDATYFDIHKQTDYDADYAAASRAVVCLELTK